MSCSGDCNQGRECNCKCKMTDREEFELKISMEYEQPPCMDRDCDGYADGYVDNAWWGWQARGELNAVKIKELEALKIAHLVGNPLKEIQTLSLQVQVLRDAVSMVLETHYFKFMGNGVDEKIQLIEVLTATPSQDEWVRKSEIGELTAKLDNAKEALNMANWNQIGGYEGQQKWLELNRELDK